MFTLFSLKIPRNTESRNFKCYINWKFKTKRKKENYYIIIPYFPVFSTKILTFFFLSKIIFL